MDVNPKLGPNTLLQHFAEDDKLNGAVVQPIFQNSLFVFDTYEEFCSGIYDKPEGPPYHYSRLGNPTLEIAERKIAMLEGAEACKVIGTGMGAAALAIMSATAAGSHVVAVDTIYGPSHAMLSEYLTRFGVSVTFVQGSDPDEVIDALRPETTAMYLESPSSLLFYLQDIERITNVTRERGVTTIFDNTYSTPLYQSPIAMGIDIVVHSATKYLGGHSDITAGAICASQERMQRMIRQEVNLFGSILGPFQAWLLTRGMRTLSLRLKQHEASGNAIAAWLEERREVERVHHVALPTHPQRELFLKQMRGSGGLFSFEPVCQDKEKLIRFVEALNLFQIGVSWGGFESLAVPILMQPMGWDAERWIIRLYCGLEDTADLIADLEQAFAAAEM